MRPLDEDAGADIVIVGGGYLGLWTAWHLLELEPNLDLLLLESEICGHGPSGRNGGFCETLWWEVSKLRDRNGDAEALAVCRASEDAVHGIGAWCESNDVDAWFRLAPMLNVATTESQLGSWDEDVQSCEELGGPGEIVAIGVEETRARCASPLFLGGALHTLNATVQPARLALGLRRRLLERGVRIHERTHVTGVHSNGDVDTRHGSVRARAAVLAVNSATVGFPGYRRSLAVASSHIVLTEPVPDVLEELGWTGGEAIVDSRTLVHYMRTTPDGRIAFGWGGGTMGFDGRASRRLEVDTGVIGGRARASLRFFPQLRGRKITHAWGGPIDVSPTHLPDLRQPRPRSPRVRVHGEWRRAVVPGRRDPRPPRARPPRRANRARDRGARPQAVPAGAVSLRRRLAHPPCADSQGRRRGRRPGSGSRRRGSSRRSRAASACACLARS